MPERTLPPATAIVHSNNLPVNVAAKPNAAGTPHKPAITSFWPDGPAYDLTFPLDLQKYKYYILFDFRKFTRRTLEEREFWAPIGGIRLPMPSNLVDSHVQKWGESEAGSVVGTIIELLAAGGNANLSEFNRSALQELWEAAYNAGNELVKKYGHWTSALEALGIAGIIGLLGQTGNYYTGIYGKAINPFMTVLYQSPTFKRHAFQWWLTPTNTDETTRLRDIIAKFRYHSLPELTRNSGNLLLDYPDMCYVAMYPEDQYLYRFKPCVVEKIEAHFAPNARTPAFYRQTNAPVEAVISINLLEIEYWVKEDIRKTWNTSTPPPAVGPGGTEV